MFVKIIKIIGWVLVCVVLAMTAFTIYSLGSLLVFFSVHRVSLLVWVYITSGVSTLVAIASGYFILKRLIKGTGSVKNWFFILAIIFQILSCGILISETLDVAFITAFSGG